MTRTRRPGARTAAGGRFGARPAAWLAPTWLVLAPLLAGAEGEGCGGAAFSESPAPDMSGAWRVTYEDTVGVRVGLGGAVYDATIGAEGGAVTIDHEGEPFRFDLACEEETIVCPWEAWARDVSFRQDDARYPHRIYLQVPDTVCDGALIDPDPDACGPDTPNPECEPVCDGDVRVVTREAFGVIDEPGERFSLLLGGSAVSNGVNCALLGLSVAEGDLTTTGGPDEDAWVVDSVPRGEVVTGYAGGCLWAGDPNLDGELEALVLGATLEFRVPYSAVRRRAGG